MFRASPWISYEPAESKTNHGSVSDPIKATTTINYMDEDVDMDIPQISILHEEESPPPPQPTRTSKFRVKLLVNDAKAAPSSPGSASRKPPSGQWEEPSVEDEEDQEDQLMDDDDQVNPSSLPKRRPSSKRKPRRNDRRTADDEKKGRDKGHSQADSTSKQDTPPRDVSDVPVSGNAVPPEPNSTRTPLKRGTTSRLSAPQRSKGKAVVPRSVRDLAVPSYDDGNVSETYTGTAASSPAPFHPDGSPEPENYGPIASVPSTEDINLDSIPLPIYPLPSKPFPVQPPPKIGTGFAPIIPLDKSRKKPRHWRVANREIRGIAGGRWFAHAWVGEKESEYATAVASGSTSKATDGMTLPKLSSVSISGISSGKASSRLKGGAGSASNSRASSTMPDRDRDPHATRAPTRMRSSMLAGPASEGGNDSDMAIPGS